MRGWSEKRGPLQLAEAKKNNRKCPSCKTRLLVTKKGPRGTFISCSGYPVCKHIEDAKEERSPKKASGGRR